MKISIFLSYPRPHLKEQQEFVERLKNYLLGRGFVRAVVDTKGNPPKLY
jgi:hypothetical protein